MKNPTLRKVRNRGFEPIRYRLPETRGCVHGWIIERGSKYLLCYFIALGKRRVPLSEERWMVAL